MSKGDKILLKDGRQVIFAIVKNLSDDNGEVIMTASEVDLLPKLGEIMEKMRIKAVVQALQIVDDGKLVKPVTLSSVE